MSASQLNRVVVVGASAAGLSAAEALRRGGFDGSLVLLGDEQHLPYDRPPLSKQVLAGTWPAERTALRRAADLDTFDLRLGVPATALSTAARTVTLADGTELGYDGLIIATGVRPRSLPGRGTHGVHVLHKLEDALDLRGRLTGGGRLVIAGAGFLGTEVAAVARELGATVSLAGSSSLPLANTVGDEVGEHLARMHTGRGVDLRLGAAVAGIGTASGRASGVHLTDGTFLAADDVLIAIGSRPNTEWLDGSGLAITDGVVCDEHGRAAPGVYAAGDVARWHDPRFGVSTRFEHRTNAAEQGIAAARNLLHPAEAKTFAPVPYFWSDQYEVKIHSYGWLRGHDEARVVVGAPEEGAFLVAYRKGERLCGVLAVGIPPKLLRTWRTALAQNSPWADAVGRTA